jgi:hypothetical protein
MRINSSVIHLSPQADLNLELILEGIRDAGTTEHVSNRTISRRRQLACAGLDRQTKNVARRHVE